MQPKYRPLIVLLFLALVYAVRARADGDRCAANQAECDRQREEQKKAHEADKPAENAKKAFGKKKK
jgi:hypothetical protein